LESHLSKKILQTLCGEKGRVSGVEDSDTYWLLGFMLRIMANYFLSCLPTLNFTLYKEEIKQTLLSHDTMRKIYKESIKTGRNSTAVSATSDTQWRKVTQWHKVTHGDTKWHKVTHGDTKWHTLTQSDTQWHKVTRSDTATL
jgi:hypothetical protein